MEKRNIWDDCIGSTDFDFWDEIEHQEEYESYNEDEKGDGHDN